MHITDSIHYIGVNDHEIDLFEGIYDVPHGMAYNSYVILDEKIAVMDTVEARFTEPWLEQLESALQGRTPDYLVVHHMEPDHSSNIVAFMDKYSNAVVLASGAAFKMLKNFYGTDYADRRIVVWQGSTLELGHHTLHFYAAPMVHWPEVMVSYESEEKVLFSADAFGKFGALDYDDPEGWACEARRYYFGIVGKFGVQVQALLKKLGGLDIATICSLHGPVLTGDLSEYLTLYDTWSAYRPETEGVFIAYTSVYGHTKEAAELLCETLRAKGCEVVISDLARSDLYECVEDAFRYSKLVLATTTYNTGVFPPMRTFIGKLTERAFQNRTVGLIDNGSWAPSAAKGMLALLDGSKNLTFTNTTVRIDSALNDASRAAIAQLADELMA